MKFIKNTEVILRYADKGFRNSGVSDQVVVDAFKNIHSTLKNLHDKDVIVGDFNDLNILVDGSQAYFIDTDSYQYKNYLCRVFTEKFVDPLLCDPTQSRPVLIKYHNKDGDWYSFNCSC